MKNPLYPCPKCGTDNTRCWNDYAADYVDNEGRIVTLPVGEFVCEECGRYWVIEEPEADNLTLYADAIEAHRYYE